MLVDLLEMEGWMVYYLGANVPEERVLSMVKRIKPDLLCISVTMSYNVKKAKLIIREIKKDEDTT